MNFLLEWSLMEAIWMVMKMCIKIPHRVQVQFWDSFTRLFKKRLTIFGNRQGLEIWVFFLFMNCVFRIIHFWFEGILLQTQLEHRSTYINNQNNSLQCDVNKYCLKSQFVLLLNKRSQVMKIRRHKKKRCRKWRQFNHLINIPQGNLQHQQ